MQGSSEFIRINSLSFGRNFSTYHVDLDSIDSSFWTDIFDARELACELGALSSAAVMRPPSVLASARPPHAPEIPRFGDRGFCAALLPGLAVSEEGQQGMRAHPDRARGSHSLTFSRVLDVYFWTQIFHHIPTCMRAVLARPYPIRPSSILTRVFRTRLCILMRRSLILCCRPYCGRLSFATGQPTSRRAARNTQMTRQTAAS